MRDDEAVNILGLLVGTTTGWNDEAVVAYAAEMRTHHDPAAMLVAVQHIARTWTEARRPPLATILDAYRTELARRQPAPTREIGGRRVPPEEGILIARTAYEDECRRLGKRPNDYLFDRIIRSVSRTEGNV